MGTALSAGGAAPVLVAGPGDGRATRSAGGALGGGGGGSSGSGYSEDVFEDPEDVQVGSYTKDQHARL